MCRACGPKPVCLLLRSLERMMTSVTSLDTWGPREHPTCLHPQSFVCRPASIPPRTSARPTRAPPARC
eukprot:scaffold44944_cov41-Tisochrysis_lutea.AAC.3